MQSLDLNTRPILPQYKFDSEDIPQKIEIDAFWLRSGEYASSCTPSNCPMFTPDLGERPTLDNQT